MAYNVTGLAAGTTLDLTRPVSVTLGTPQLNPPCRPVLRDGGQTLPKRPSRASRAKPAPASPYYQYRGSNLTLTVVALPNGQYTVELEASGVDLSAVDQSQPVVVTLSLGGQTFTAQTQPASPHNTGLPAKMT